MAVPASSSFVARLSRGVSWSLVATCCNQGSTFAVNIIVANLLHREVFGQYTAIQNTLATAGNMASFGLGYTAMKYLAEFRSTDQAKAGRILGLCTVVALATGAIAALFLAVASVGIAQQFLNAPSLAPGLMIAAGGLLVSPLIALYSGALAGLESYRALGRAGIVSGGLYLTICSLAASGGDLTGVVAAVAAALVLQCLVLRAALLRETKAYGIVVSYRKLYQERSIVLNFALPAALAGFTAMPAVWLANVFLLRLPDGYSQFALYSAAANFRVIALFPPNIVNNVTTSLLNHEKAVGEGSRFYRLFWLNAGLTAAVVVAVASVLAVLGPWLLRAFGRDYTEGYPVLLLLLCCVLPEGLVQAPYQLLPSHGRMWLSLFANAIPRDITLVLLSFLLSHVYGASGLALSHLGAQVVSLLLVSLAAYVISRRPVT